MVICIRLEEVVSLRSSVVSRVFIDFCTPLMVVERIQGGLIRDDIIACLLERPDRLGYYNGKV
jgi:hypothetical protein